MCDNKIKFVLSEKNMHWTYVFIVTALFFGLAFFVSCNVFKPREWVCLTSEAIPQEMKTMDIYKDIYDVFDKQYTRLLATLSFLFTVFGIALPAGAYLLQRQSLKDERESIMNEFKEKLIKVNTELENSKVDFETRKNNTDVYIKAQAEYIIEQQKAFVESMKKFASDKGYMLQQLAKLPDNIIPVVMQVFYLMQAIHACIPYIKDNLILSDIDSFVNDLHEKKGVLNKLKNKLKDDDVMKLTTTLNTLTYLKVNLAHQADGNYSNVQNKLGAICQVLTDLTSPSGGRL